MSRESATTSVLPPWVAVAAVDPVGLGAGRQLGAPRRRRRLVDPSSLVDRDAVVVEGALRRDEIAEHVVPDRLDRTLPGLAPTRAAAGADHQAVAFVER